MRKVISTGSGMYGLWDTAAYSKVIDYDTWDRRLCEDADIEKEISAGTFVPINIGSDGVSEVEARVGTAAQPAMLSDRERGYACASTSLPYLLVTSGIAHFGGIEHVESVPSSSCGRIELKPGRYEVSIHLIDWASEPGMATTDDKPAPNALPDFILLINPAAQGVEHRRALQTFER